MRLVRALIAVLGLVSVAAAGDIDGKIVGWPAAHEASARAGVVWTEGMGLIAKAAGKTQPVMAQHGGKFVPSFLVVVAGQTVVMPNEDEVAHNVYSLSPAKQFDLGFYAKGDDKTVTFDKPGMVDVLCVIHHFMRARILVVPNSHYSIIAADGSFHIRDLPAGSFTLYFWGDGMESFTQQVMVPDGGKTVKVSIPLPAASTGK